MKARVILPLLLLLGVAAGAEEAADAGVPWWQIFIPNAFAPSPLLQMSAYTEFASGGHEFPPATPEHPVYFVAQSQGYHPMGAPVAGDHPPAEADMERILFRSLAAQGYLPANDAAHPPSLVLIYYWGVHYNLDLELAMRFPEMHEQYLQERAVLVGGKKYARQFSLQLQFGTTLADQSVYKNFLRNQAAQNLYYVVVSAYSFAALARNEHRPLWRTTLTVGAQGVSMRESLPALILTGGQYFGREMSETVALRRYIRRGTVTLGPLQVIESDVPLPAPHREK